MRVAWLVVAVAGCGDNLYPPGDALAPSSDVTIVAHQDDDLLFMQPDLLEAIRRGTGVTNVYVTAGNGRGGLDEAEARERGLLRAYTALTGTDAWFCGTIELAGHTALHCRLDPARLSLVFLGYPDGGKQGEHADSLARLWDGSIDAATTVARHPTRYDRAGLIAAVAAVIDATAPSTIRTLEVASTHGRDHVDHQVTGALAVVATAASRVHPAVVAFRGYNTELEPPNLIEPLFARSAEILAHYRGCPGDCVPISPAHETWLHRRYAVAMRPVAAGALRAEGRCAFADDTGAWLAACAGAPRWELAADGTLTAGERCVEIAGDELRTAASCAPDPARRFFLDDEGHLFAGAPVPRVPGTARLLCIVPGDRLRAVPCGDGFAPVWELSPAPTQAPRPAGLTRGGRAVRLADLDGDGLADLCAIEDGNLACARGDGAGDFAAMTSFGALAVEPDSLVIGDVDGDGAPDACGRDAGGISCARAATGFTAGRWTGAFATGGAATAGSLAAVDANGDGATEICGLAAEGVVCAYGGFAAQPSVRSTWPARDAVVWPGDLDGDGKADWCATSTSAAGIACGLDLHRDLTTDGVPWSFARGGLVEPGPTDVVTGALGDIDGDGRADLCSVRDLRITCARSQGHGFGPAVTLGTLEGGAPTALWLGDLDGDGAADACVDDGLAIRCLRSR